MKEKSQTVSLLKKLHAMVQNQFHTNIQVLKTDNARDYFNSTLSDYFFSSGIVHQSSCNTTPQQNGVAKRKNRHLLDVSRSLLFTMNVPKSFWGEVVLTATYLTNRMPSRILGFKTPCQALLDVFPTTHLLSNIPLKVFGCTSFVHIHSQHWGKLDPRSLKCIFLGYSSNQKGYKCYSPSTRKFYNSMDVTFIEHLPFFPNTPSQGESNEDLHNWVSLHSPNFPAPQITSVAPKTIIPGSQIFPNQQLAGVI